LNVEFINQSIHLPGLLTRQELGRHVLLSGFAAGLQQGGRCVASSDRLDVGCMRNAFTTVAVSGILVALGTSPTQGQTPLPNPTQQQVASDQTEVPVYRITVVGRSTPAINWRSIIGTEAAKHRSISRERPYCLARRGKQRSKRNGGSARSMRTSLTCMLSGPDARGRLR
jgi:hypothetical protein